MQTFQTHFIFILMFQRIKEFFKCNMLLNHKLEMKTQGILFPFKLLEKDG